MNKFESAAAEITPEWVIYHFKQVVESDESWKLKLQALTKMGEYLKMFTQHKKIDIDIKQLFARMPDAQVAELASAAVAKGVAAESIRLLGEGDAET